MLLENNQVVSESETKEKQQSVLSFIVIDSVDTVIPVRLELKLKASKAEVLVFLHNKQEPDVRSEQRCSDLNRASPERAT